MSSNVFFANMRTRSHADSKIAKVNRLCDAVGLAQMVKPEELVAVKLHFGEYGNDTFLHPPFAGQVVNKIKACGAKPFLTDTSTLYSGSRRNAVDHLNTAYGHGFSPATVNAPVIIADGLFGQNDEAVAVNLKHFKEVHIATEIWRAPSMVVLSHFKGHEMAGFGGAIKNLAMGCASVAGKRDQHATRVVVNTDTCVGCGMCESVCPVAAARLDDSGKASIDPSVCIGCFECITVCQVKAIDLDWATELPLFMERMTEYAYGAVHNKAGRVCYINFVLNVTPDCDCAAWSDAPLVPDLGILASRDPVALDQACYDLVKNAQSINGSCGCDSEKHGTGLDKFAQRWDKTCGTVQLTYGEAIGLGSTQYTLVEV